MVSLALLTDSGEAHISADECRHLQETVTNIGWDHIVHDFNPCETGRPSLLRTALGLPDHILGTSGNEFEWRARVHLADRGPTISVHLPGAPHAATAADVTTNSVVTDHCDPVALAAHLITAGERNTWVDGTDRTWLADLIDAGRHCVAPHTTGSLFDPTDADHSGWAAMARLLRAGTGIAVFNLGVVRGFPSRIWASTEGQNRKQFHEWWREASPADRWSASETGLPECGPVLRPEGRG